MDPIQLLILIAVLAILTEVTYLVSKQKKQPIVRQQKRSVLVDTSVLMDGRILAVVQTGFIGDTLVIPRSVIGELQFLADNADHEKRGRARYGLDAVAELQASDKVDTQILQDGSKADEGVDERLLNLAKKHDALICTLDFNLSKVATVEGIAVLNLNELAQSIRMAHLPGDRMRLEMVQKGQDGHQAVAYLPDGTMVVVEQASRLIGQSADIEIIRSLQTAAGKMMFARLVEVPQAAKPKAKPTGKRVVKSEQTVKASPAEPVRAEVAKKDDQPKADRPPSKRRKSDQEQSSQVQQSQPPRQPQQKSRRPKTQAQREADFLNLLDRQ
jgi:rRNA-processing protein FCF1